MKLTNLALIFVIIILPMIVMVYVNTSFVVKSQKEEMYYKNVIDSAVKDANNQMKHVENEDMQIDYGYSGSKDKKVSVNTDVAIDAFYNSLFNNFGILGNKKSEDSFKSYIPVIAIFDYDGIYIHSAEDEYDDFGIYTGVIKYTTKPKQYYTYVYGIRESNIGGLTIYNIVDGDDIEKKLLLDGLVFEVTYTMDEDFIYLEQYYLNDPPTTNVISNRFYINDNYNSVLTDGFTSVLSEDLDNLKKIIITNIKEKRKMVIANIAMDAISYAANAHNYHIKNMGITYHFAFLAEDEPGVWFDNINGIGLMAMVQGIPLGNRYLNYKAYSISSLSIAKKYYLSTGITDDLSPDNGSDNYLKQKLYHLTDRCPIYKEYVYRMLNDYTVLSPKFYLLKSEAAENGYSPCPVCKP